MCGGDCAAGNDWRAYALELIEQSGLEALRTRVKVPRSEVRGHDRIDDDHSCESKPAATGRRAKL